MSYTSTQAVAQAIQSTKDTKTWPDLCLSFVAHMYGLQASGTPDPKTAYNAWVHNPNKHSGDTNPPAGALVFWRNKPGTAGHVALSVGNGKVVSTHGMNGRPAVYSINDIHIPNYLGWTDPGFGANSYAVPNDFGGSTTVAPSVPTSVPTRGGLNAGGDPGKVQQAAATQNFVEQFVTNPVGAVTGLIQGANPLNAFEAMASRFLWITLPSSWIRIQAGIAGLILLILAIILFAWEGASSG